MRVATLTGINLSAERQGGGLARLMGFSVGMSKSRLGSCSRWLGLSSKLIRLLVGHQQLGNEQDVFLGMWSSSLDNALFGKWSVVGGMRGAS